MGPCSDPSTFIAQSILPSASLLLTWTDQSFVTPALPQWDKYAAFRPPTVVTHRKSCRQLPMAKRLAIKRFTSAATKQEETLAQRFEFSPDSKISSTPFLNEKNNY